ncbi:hypothetical protein BC939DRAFT_457268 [Gamsiella multidivaricata]|uniref:uncharacterized protein n=1 Tax=Gamsiella multidivaricata TaxID=101098 RepID=UPI00221F0511|nr:uncharacterized protein BC939DRAFT_457268 [Gamsiella multidivaricata]KAG0369942.1 hypothetical protein BGZ54_008337 [Gamsiella multidivaricata]KAI7820651.1 hypothetical protein BC939DRAFT_457268 [Gamsiella multidivaricata]
MTDSSPNGSTTASATSSEFLTSAPPSSTSLKALPRPISIRHSQSYEPSPPSPTSPPLNELRGARSSASLNLLASTTPLHQYRTPHSGQRSQRQPSKSSSFSNPFKKLQNTFGGSGKRSLDLGSTNNTNIDVNDVRIKPERVVSSSLSASSLTSWRSKGAEMLSKSLGRNRKNSEPLLKSTASASVTGSVIFGAHLEDAIQASHIPDTPMVPAVLYRCAEFLEVKGVDEVGLYRVPGSHANVQKLKRMFDTGKDYNLLTMDGIDPNDIATLLKLYLRELPSPLLPAALLQQFQSLLTTDRHICQTLRGILVRLPRSSYIALSFLCHHLSKIAAHDDKTKMTVSNLGVVFAPTLAIGSVLFKALLGGFYDGVDTPENREKGLKIVWGGLLQDGNNIQEWPEAEEETGLSQFVTAETSEGDKIEYDEAKQEQDQGQNDLEQLQHYIFHHQSLPALSPFSDEQASTTATSYFGPVSHHGIGPLDLDDRPVYGQIITDPSSLRNSISSESLDDSTANDESTLMKAMLQREELATKPPPSPSSSGSDSAKIHSAQESPSAATPANSAIPPSHLTLTAAITSNQTTTSTDSSPSTRVNKIADPALSPPFVAILPSPTQSAAVLHITIDAGAVPPVSISASTSAASNSKESSPTTATVPGIDTRTEYTPDSGKTSPSKSETGTVQIQLSDPMPIPI